MPKTRSIHELVGLDETTREVVCQTTSPFKSLSHLLEIWKQQQIEIVGEVKTGELTNS
jgi:hypothetical protein